MTAHATTDWSPDSWRARPEYQRVPYPSPAEVEAVVARIRSLPPLVTAWEVERLRALLAEAEEGRRFVLQGGDCAETLADCRPEVVENKLKILLQMSLVLIQGGKRPVVRIGRFAGQYAKPRSSPTEVQNGLELPSYFGDLVNRPAFDAASRRADPSLLLEAYTHAAMTLNHVRALSASGFADIHHPEYWDLSFFEHAELPAALRDEYVRTSRQVAEALEFMEALGETSMAELSRVDFFTSHEGLNLFYESAQARLGPFNGAYYDLSAHLPWIGERTRALDGAHVEFFRGVRNPLGIKLGPKVTPDDLRRLADVLNPANEPGRLVFITRMGAGRVADTLPRLVEALRREGRRGLWVCDPMHGNTHATSSGVKTRDFDEILRETETTFDVHEAAGTHLGGVHFELTGEDVTECVGGAAGITERDLDRNYASLCDPRLNYRQSLEMAFRLARRMARAPR
jgi:3-deoxy-7-phosphoheptulonate synthase